MRFANIDGRAVVLADEGAIDVAGATGGRIGPDPVDALDAWSELVAAAPGFDPALAQPWDDAALGAPSPRPRQVFAIGLNYRSHAEESGMAVPDVPATFTKFPACITGPFAEVEVAGDTVDWEVELVVVIGARADRVEEGDAWTHVAGLTVGQDLTDRTLQFAAGGQFSLGKSHRGFGPTGPWLVTADEFPEPDDLALGCSVDGTPVQAGRTSDLVFGVASLIAQLSAVVSLLPGDLVFTGTPSGVGMAAQPPRFLRPGEVVESWVEGIGTIRNRMVAPGGVLR